MVDTPATPALRKLLSQIFVGSLDDSQPSMGDLSRAMGVDEDYVQKLCGRAEELRYVKTVEDRCKLTENGRRAIIIVFTGGVYDIIHPGHIHALTSSKALGDVLIVSVARDITAAKRRNAPPLNNEKARRDLVGSLKMVDAAILGSETNIFDTVAKVKPDIITLGYDQKHDDEAVRIESLKRGVNVKVVRLDSPVPGLKSTAIKNSRDVMNQI
ncbi:MAG: FAD synthase [Thaumarchaeota archaeon]|nr:FAD synthase [Nitrososphaerota archaeon]